MSNTTTQNVKRKNIIFVTGNGISEYKVVAENIARNLDKSVLIDEPKIIYENYPTVREIGARKSIYFSQLLFYSSLPSRKSVVICTPNLNLRTILQVLILLENIPKNVFVVVDDRCFLTAFGKKKFDDLFSLLPEPSKYYLTHYMRPTNEKERDAITRLCAAIERNAFFASSSTHCNFNKILARIPLIFQEEVKKAIYGTEFSDIPFEKITCCLLPKFNDAEEEEEEEKERAALQKPITDYFSPIKKDSLKISPLESDDELPTLNVVEPEPEFLSLMDFGDLDNNNGFPLTQPK